MKRIIVRSAIAIAAVAGLATPAVAAVDLDVKRAIVEVVLENLGVDASAEFILGIAQELDTAELDAGLVTAVTNLLDAGTDPRSVIESQTDANGDGIPDEGSALDSPDDSAGDDEGEDEAENEDESEDETDESEEEESEDEDDD